MHNKCLFVLVLGILCHASLVKAAEQYSIQIDTRRIEGTEGFVDFQLTNNTVQTVQAIPSIRSTVKAFEVQQGALLGEDSRTGDLRGALPRNLQIFNLKGTAEFTQKIRFGKSLRFQLWFDGEAFTHPDCHAAPSTFLFSVLDTKKNPLLSADAYGTLLMVSVLPNGQTQDATFPKDPPTPLIDINRPVYQRPCPDKNQE